VITTDKGNQFNADMTRIFLDLYDVYIHFFTEYHLETNDLTENRNREIGKYLGLLEKKRTRLGFSIMGLKNIKKHSHKIFQF